MNGRKTVWCAAIGLLLSVALSEPVQGNRPRMRTGTVIENFDAGNIELLSFPGEDFDPHGIMDVRFASNRVFAIADTAGTREWPIQVSSATYPITLSWSLSPAPLRPSLHLDDRVLSMETPGSVTVSNPPWRLSLVLSRAPDLPHELALGQNYPNPFNPVTTISYSLPALSAVSLNVFSLTGQLVRTLFKGDQNAGRYSIVWDGTSDSRICVSSGVYFYQLNAGTAVLTRKLLLLK